MSTCRLSCSWSALVVIVSCAVTMSAQSRGDGPAATPKTSAPADLTGSWVALVTEDWRYRQFAAPKGDYTSLPLNPAGRKVADAWDPAADEAAGQQCKAYGAAGVMRMPTHLRISWLDDTTLKVETDAGTQTRLLGFGAPRGTGGSWQGVSTASWDYPRARFAARGVPPVPPGGAMKVVTTQMRPGYLRRNGVPYSATATMTEYFQRLDVPGGEVYLLVIAEVADPEYLAAPYWTSTQFRRQATADGWSPTPCAVR